MNLLAFVYLHDSSSEEKSAICFLKQKFAKNKKENFR